MSMPMSMPPQQPPKKRSRNNYNFDFSNFNNNLSLKRARKSSSASSGDKSTHKHKKKNDDFNFGFFDDQQQQQSADISDMKSTKPQIPPKYNPNRIIQTFANNYRSGGVDALCTLVAASDFRYYDGALITDASRVTQNPQPLVVGYQKELDCPAKLLTVYNGRAPILFVLLIRRPGPGEMRYRTRETYTFDGKEIHSGAELIFWTVQHELLHLLARIQGLLNKSPLSSQREKHCSKILQSVGESMYGSEYQWSTC